MNSRQKLMFAVAVVLALAFPVWNWGQGNVEQEIRNLESQSREAALRGDVTFLERTLADTYVGINPMGEKMTRDQLIQLRKSGDLKYQSIDVSEMDVRVYGNTAVVSMHSNVKGTLKGQDISGEYRTTRTWVKQPGGWKQVSFETTPVKTAR